MKTIVCILMLFVVIGCSVETEFDRNYVSKGIQQRSPYEVGPKNQPGEIQVPQGVTLEDGITFDEAVMTALWNNAQFEADLATLGFARADLIEANMLANPTFSILFPVDTKPLKTVLHMPVEALWQRPRQLKAAQYDAEILAENLIEHGLGLIRDVQVTYATLQHTQEKLRLADRVAQVHNQLAQLMRKRQDAGDISELESQTAAINAIRAQDTVLQLSQETTLLQHRLKSIMGISSSDIPIQLARSTPLEYQDVSLDELMETALAVRPDLRAAELSIEAACERIGWEKSKAYRLIAALDGEEDVSTDDFIIRPGFEVEIPVFNQNDGKTARAKAEMEQAIRRFEALRQSIMLEVNEAYTQYNATQVEHTLWQSKIIPSLRKQNQQANKSYDAGQESYMMVLEMQKELILAQMRKADLMSELSQSAAQLNYRVGKTIL